MSLSIISRQRSWSDIEQVIHTKLDQIDDRDDIGNTALYYACKAGQVKIVSLLIDSHANINKKSFGGLTPLMIAAQNGHLNCVEILINCQADIMLTCDKGNTALHKAVEGNHHECIRPLIQAGAQPTFKNNDGFSAYDLCTSGHMSRLLYLTSLEISPLHYASYLDNEEKLVQELLQDDVDINQRSVHEMTPLMIASEKGNLSSLQILLSSTPSADPNLSNQDGDTALHLATKNGHWKLIEPLLRAGGNPSLRNKEGETVFDIPNSGYIQRIIRDFNLNTSSKK